MTLLNLHIIGVFLLLVLLEIVLGVDNLIFITIVSNRLPENQQSIARRLGLGLAVISRLVLLAFAFWLIHLTEPLFHILTTGISARDLLLIIGGGFLIVTACKELLTDIFQKGSAKPLVHPGKTFLTVVIKIILFDILFSLDSVITAVGVASQYWVMALAIIVAVILMVVASDYLSRLIKIYWRIRMLALCFLILVGIMLLLHGCHIDVPRAYLYTALIFSIFVETINHLYEKFKEKKQI